jgi:aspartate/methionine/tyrosine aminotransferase
MTANTQLSQSLDNLLKAKDRTNLNLPETQFCDTCQQDLLNTAFNLKKKNQYTAHLADELEPTCKKCKQTGKKVLKGAFVKTLSQGSLLLSDAAIEWLQADNGKNQKDVISSLGAMAKAQDIDAMKLLINLVQGRAAVYKVEAPLTPVRAVG